MKPAMLVATVLAFTILLPLNAGAFPVDFGHGFVTQRINVAGDVVSVTVGGHGPVVVLLHGYAEDSRMWRPLAIALAIATPSLGRPHNARRLPASRL